MKIKRLVALLMAVMLVVGIFAVPASAAMKCRYCVSTDVHQNTYEATSFRREEYCRNYANVHSHHVRQVYLTYKCGNGHYWETLDRADVTCPYGPL